uniref:S-layer homology domain-containing protein n=1 Tax=Gloeocapsa sp. PCC 7428 TaxID=1173026 RepID=UPI001E4D8D71|nr:S-layer homology domain-containing protein [Gloeocapsa sp. PCC 7428]
MAVLLASVGACASNQSGRNLEQMFAADPRLQDNPAIAFGTGNNNSNETALNTSVQLPADFPSEIPRYPNAQLQQVTASETRWVTPDPINVVQSFYQNQFQANNWELRQPNEQQGTLEAQRNGLRVTLTFSVITNQNSIAQANGAGNTEFTLQYTRDTTATTSPSPDASDLANVPQPGDPEFIGPVLPQQADQTAQTANSVTQSTAEQAFNDISQVPQELRQYLQDLSALGVLPLQATSKSNSATNQFEPNKTITRREYARWLVAANNRFYTDNPAKQIREASASTQPAFQDVPASDPDFAVIQGLAEAGLIPSPLSGSSTTVLFRPDAPLTREQMILWKVPIDTRSSLPNASVDAVQQTWGFQDAAKIEPRALQAVLADFQNSDRANIRRVFGYTTLFQPKKTVTRAEAAAALWYIGTASEGVSAQDALRLQQSSPSQATSDAPATRE